MTIADAILKLAIVLTLISISENLFHLTAAVLELRSIELVPPCLIEAKELPR